MRANDTYYRFRPGTDFYYLTGNLEPDCVLVLQPKAGGGHTDVLFVEPNPGRSDATFFTDRDEGRAVGRPAAGRRGEPGALRRRRGRAACPSCRRSWQGSPAARHAPRAARLLERRWTACCPPQADARQGAGHARSPRCGCSRTRRRSRELQAAIDSTQRGFEDVIARLKPAKSEREVEGVFNLRARVEGNDVGYGTIAAAGAHACIAALDAQRRRAEEGRAAAARCRRRGQHALHRRHHPHAADPRQVHQGAARDLRAGARGAAARPSRR